MKKLLAVLAAAIMVIGMTVPAFAESFTFGSQGNTVEIQGDGITVTDTDIKLTQEEADKLIGDNQSQGELAIVLNGKDIKASSTPVTLSFTVNGTASPQKIYVFHYIDDAWKLEGSGDPKTVTITVDKLSPFAVVVYTPAGGKSPATGETNAVPFVLAAVIAAGALAFVFAPKKRNA